MRQLAVISNYRELIAVLRARAEALDVSNLTLDEISGLPSGYAGKVLSINGRRHLGPLSLPLLLDSLGLRLAVLEDEQLLAQVRSRLVNRRRGGPRRQIEPKASLPENSEVR
jgi:hypothetical protein